MPPLGLLPSLSKGKVTSDMKDVLLMTDKLKADLNQMLKEHEEIVAVLEELVTAARKERKLKYVRFADRLTLHARTEEEIYYPAAILIGEYLKLKLARMNAKKSSKRKPNKKTDIGKKESSSKGAPLTLSLLQDNISTEAWIILV